MNIDESWPWSMEDVLQASFLDFFGRRENQSMAASSC